MIETERLVLRPWRDADREPFAALNADPVVMEHFPNILTRAESDAAIDRNNALIATHRWGNFAVERRVDGAMIGHIGVKPTGSDLPFGGLCEVGWRLARETWGVGYASEGARAILTYSFADLRLPEVVAFTTLTNTRSEAVMRRIGMTRAADRDFDHPALPKGHPLERHIVYVAVRSDPPWDRSGELDAAVESRRPRA